MYCYLTKNRLFSRLQHLKASLHLKLTKMGVQFAHPDWLPTFRPILLGLTLFLIGLGVLDGWTPQLLALLFLTFCTTLPLQTVQVALLIGLGTVLIGLLNIEALKARQLVELGSIVVFGTLISRFLRGIEWRLAHSTVLTILTDAETKGRHGDIAFTVNTLIEQTLTLLRDFARADAAIALRQLDAVTAEALVCLPAKVFPDQLTSPKLFEKAITQNRCLHYPDYPSTPGASRILLARGTKSLSVLPLTLSEIPVFAAFLTKPIKQFDLYNVLIHILGGAIQVEPNRATPPSQINPQLAAFPLQILLAEDNVVNQKVALHLLRSLGYQADVASNGLEVLAALERQSYDVVLMDVQMPKMDGLTATRCIIQKWSHAARPRIIAMTANAMQGDCEECLKAGMDDYLSKPIRLEELSQALARTGEAGGAISGAGDSGPPRGIGVRAGRVGEEERITNSPIDPKVLQSFRAMMGENGSEIVVEMIDCYLEDAPKLIEAIAKAVAQADATQLSSCAHTLKSSSATLGATTLSHLCKELEVISSTGNINLKLDKVPQLEAEFARVKLVLIERRQQV